MHLKRNKIYVPWPSYHEYSISVASCFMQDHGKEIEKMKAVEEKRRVRNQCARDVCSMAPIIIQMAAIEYFCLLFCVLLSAEM